MHTLLARRVAAGRRPDAQALRRAIEDMWCDPLVNRRWQRLSLRLTAADCERIVQLAVRRGLAGTDCRLIAFESATDGWALEARGYAKPAPSIHGAGSERSAAARPGRAGTPHGARGARPRRYLAAGSAFARRLRRRPLRRAG